ncbi:hypothetical protein V2W45_1517797 [Cenococcum geophilum]
MKFPASLFAFEALFVIVFASPLPDAEPTCIHTVMKLPSVDTDCTFYANTKTLTEYTDCGGCALGTKYYGVGLACQTSTTIGGITQVTATSCSSRGYKREYTQLYPVPTTPVITTTPTPTPSTCTHLIAPVLANVADHCAEWKGTTTMTSHIDCGGCALGRMEMGPGPVLVPCTSTAEKKGWKTEIVMACATST